MPKPTDADLENRFRYHPPKTDSRRAKHGTITEDTLVLAKRFRDTCPEGRCLSLALTKLEEARMWANASLAIESPTDD